MSAEVAPFYPSNGQDLANVPHMLRYWAAEFEAGRMTADALVVAAYTRGPGDPVMLGAGARLTPIELGGLGARLTALAMGYLR